MGLKCNGMGSEWDRAVSAEAWESLVRKYEQLIEDQRDDSDFHVAALLRQHMWEVEGI